MMEEFITSDVPFSIKLNSDKTKVIFPVRGIKTDLIMILSKAQSRILGKLLIELSHEIVEEGEDLKYVKQAVHHPPGSAKRVAELNEIEKETKESKNDESDG